MKKKIKKKKKQTKKVTNKTHEDNKKCTKTQTSKEPHIQNAARDDFVKKRHLITKQKKRVVFLIPLFLD